MLAHNRAFLDWVDVLLDRHPSLTIESCSSGGMRTDYALLSRFQLHSTSDQQDFLRYPPIAAAAPVAIAPEQAAVWAYPQPEWDDDQIAFTLCSAMLGRVHLSGHLDRMSAAQQRLVADAIRLTNRSGRTWRPLYRSGRSGYPLGRTRGSPSGCGRALAAMWLSGAAAKLVTNRGQTAARAPRRWPFRLRTCAARTPCRGPLPRARRCGGRLELIDGPADGEASQCSVRLSHWARAEAPCRLTACAPLTARRSGALPGCQTVSPC